MFWPSSFHIPFCATEFPQIWNSFVSTFIDASHAEGPAGSRPKEQTEELPSVLPAVPRVIAVGDLHGDLQKTRRAFQLAGLINDQDRWIGGSTTVVQVGDILDRGDHELQILFWLERLQQEAARAGGAVHVLNGNHETMNVAGQYRYVTTGGMHGFKRWQQVASVESALRTTCNCGNVSSHLKAAMHGAGSPASISAVAGNEELRLARTAALQPGGEVTRRFFARHPTVLQVGSTVFVHGGLLPEHADIGITRINKETQEWMLGKRGSSSGPKPSFLSGRSAVVWSRHYSAEDAARCDCDLLAEALRRVPGAQRMVVGHTIQGRGINSACGGKVYRIDVGMSKGCGNNSPEVLEILHDQEIRRITGTPVAAVVGGSNKENLPPAQSKQS